MTDEQPVEEEQKQYCYGCGDEVLKGDEYTFEGQLYCEDCFSDTVGFCESCGEYHYQDNMVYQDDEAWCQSCFEEAHTQCAGCNETIRESSASYFENHEQYYCEECYPSEGPVEKDMGKEIKGRTFKHNKFKRRFGVELEAENGDGEELYDLFSNNNVPWALTEDGSLDDGVEAVSPPMSGDEAYESIKQVCRLMDEAGYSTSVRAGVHVHFDFTGSVEQDIKKITGAYYLYDDFFLRMLPKSRWHNRYCERLKDGYDRLPECIFGTLKDIYNKGGDPNAKYCSLRYTTLNIHSWFYRGTLEVRAHSSTLNPEKIIRWIEIHQRFFDYAMSKPLRFWLFTKPSLRQWKEILGPKLYRYYTARVKELQCGKRVSNKDLKFITDNTKRFKKVLSDRPPSQEIFELMRGM